MHRHVLLALLALVGCKNPDAPITCSSPGAPATGPADSHCGSDVVTVDPNACTAADTGSSGDDGAPDYGATMFGTKGDDDDCKYAVTWSSTDLCENGNVYFTVGATHLVDHSPVTGANPSIESYLTSTPSHVVPNSGQATTDLGGGQYKIGPIVFDAKGEWTVRFHFFETCADSETSPHGHAAFAVDLP